MRSRSRRLLPAFGTLLTLALLLCLLSCQQGCPIVKAVLPNYVPIVVGSTVSPFTQPNIPFVSVTVCVPNTTNCQTIDNIQLDTGSPGLRIFKQALTIPLPAEQSGGNPVGECISFAVMNAWGSVATASLTLGSEPAVTVPVQIIDSTFGTSSPPDVCSSGDFTGPDEMSANGLLGVMPSQSDSASATYFTCLNGSCTSFAPNTDQTVQNPVFLLPQDNNGVLVYVDAVSTQGVPQTYGSLVLGVNTSPNNDPNFVSSGNPYKCLKASSMSFDTMYSGQDLPMSFIDSGSNMLFFPDSTLKKCLGIFVDTYCPASPVGETATMSDGSGTSLQVNFLIGSPLIGVGNFAFDDLGATQPLFVQLGFDWGMPFFYGRSIFIAYGSSSSQVCGAGGISAPEWGFAPLTQNPSP